MPTRPSRYWARGCPADLATATTEGGSKPRCFGEDFEAYVAACAAIGGLLGEDRADQPDDGGRGPDDVRCCAAADAQDWSTEEVRKLVVVGPPRTVEV